MQEQMSSPLGNTEMRSSPISEMTDVTDEEQSNDDGDEMESDRAPETEFKAEGSMMEEERMETKEMSIVNKEASQTVSASYPNPGQRVQTEKDTTAWAEIVAEAEEDDTW